MAARRAVGSARTLSGESNPTCEPRGALGNGAGGVSTSELSSWVDRKVRLAAVIAAARKLPTRRGVVQFVTFEDEQVSSKQRSWAKHSPGTGVR